MARPQQPEYISAETFKQERRLQEAASHTILLLLGTIFGTFAFLLPMCLQVHSNGLFLCGHQVLERNDPLGTNYLNQPFPSGNNFAPLTVSELVLDGSTPQGKAFFAFSFISTVFLLMSWYPWKLSHVYVGRACFGPNWLVHSLSSIHHLAPPVGMLLVTLMPTQPRVNLTFGHIICNVFHTGGAVVMLASYGVCELHCLLCHSHNKKHLPTVVRVGLAEWVCRFLLVIAMVVCGAGFITCDIINNNQVMEGLWGCEDVWRVPTETELTLMSQNSTLMMYTVTMAEAITTNKKLLYNTASGDCLFVKQGELWFEIFAGIFMLSNMFMIWWFCPERTVNLEENTATPRITEAGGLAPAFGMDSNKQK